MAMTMKVIGKIIEVDPGEFYLFSRDPEVHLEPLTALAKVKGPKRKATYRGKGIPIYL